MNDEFRSTAATVTEILSEYADFEQISDTNITGNNAPVVVVYRDHGTRCVFRITVEPAVEPVMAPFPPGADSVRAWDRTEGRSVTVHRNDWECATSCGYATVMVSVEGDTDHYYASAADLVMEGSCCEHPLSEHDGNGCTRKLPREDWFDTDDTDSDDIYCPCTESIGSAK